MKMFLHEAKPIVPRSFWAAADVGSTQEAMLEQKALNSVPFATPKPERLIRHVFEVAARPGEIVLDSFLGSGTAAAVAHKLGFPYIGIETGEHAVTHCVPRLKKVVDGDQGGISEAVGWKGGGGFHFYKLGSPVFDEEGQINPAVRFAHLAAHVWFAETRTPLPHPRRRSPLLGVHEGVGYYLLFNGILGDKRPDGGNVLTRRLLPSGRIAEKDESRRFSAKDVSGVWQTTPAPVLALGTDRPASGERRLCLVLSQQFLRARY